MFEVTLKGFKSKETAEAFAGWYASIGEDEFNRPDSSLPDGVYISAASYDWENPTWEKDSLILNLTETHYDI